MATGRLLTSLNQSERVIRSLSPVPLRTISVHASVERAPGWHGVSSGAIAGAAWRAPRGGLGGHRG
eukprot:3653282-Prymnesium_polylepis.1